MIKLILIIASMFIAGTIFYIVLGFIGVVPTTTFGMHGTPWFFHGFGMVFVWALVIALVYGFVYQTFQSTEGNRNDSLALETLKDRYARGDIDADTYKKMKSTLED